MQSRPNDQIVWYRMVACIRCQFMRFTLAMNVQILTAIPGETAAYQLEKQLREAIIQLELLPGTRLSEQEIATRYGVSRQPVREALIALAKSNLVEIRPNRGTVVVRISVQQMLEARFVREAVETAVARRACESFDSWVLQRIKTNLEQQERAVAKGDHIAFADLDQQFHQMIAKGAGCTLAWSAIADMKAHTDRVCNLTLKYPDTRADLLTQHRAILDAIIARDADKAERIMREHLQSILGDLSTVESEFPDLFEQS